MSTLQDNASRISRDSITPEEFFYRFKGAYIGLKQFRVKVWGSGFGFKVDGAYEKLVMPTAISGHSSESLGPWILEC